MAIEEYSIHPPRRAFLRGLVALPLIGGSLTLFGRPTAAAVPTSPELLERYTTWLANEHAAALAEQDRRIDYEIDIARAQPQAWAIRRIRTPLYYFPEDAHDIEAAVRATRPSTRAAVVLSVAGIPLRRAA